MKRVMRSHEKLCPLPLDPAGCVGLYSGRRMFRSDQLTSVQFALHTSIKRTTPCCSKNERLVAQNSGPPYVSVTPSRGTFRYWTAPSKLRIGVPPNGTTSVKYRVTPSFMPVLGLMFVSPLTVHPE